MCRTFYKNDEFWLYDRGDRPLGEGSIELAYRHDDAWHVIASFSSYNAAIGGWYRTAVRSDPNDPIPQAIVMLAEAHEQGVEGAGVDELLERIGKVIDLLADDPEDA